MKKKAEAKKCQKRKKVGTGHLMHGTAGSARSETAEMSSHFQGCKKAFLEALEGDIGHEVDLLVGVGVHISKEKGESEVIIVPIGGTGKGLPMEVPMKMAHCLQETLTRMARPGIEKEGLKNFLKEMLGEAFNQEEKEE